VERRVIVAPSLLACDFAHLAEEVRRVEDAGADWLHVDVMDGHFVPNLTIGPVIVEAIRRVSRLPLDVHLMLEDPARYLQPFREAGADWLTVHVEAPALADPRDLRAALEAIRAGGARAGVSLRPRTPVEAIAPFLEAVELVLVMTVEPGFGGQAFIPEVVPKVRAVRERFAYEVAVDGGLTAETAAVCRQAGANVLIAGTFVFRSASYHQAIGALRGDSPEERGRWRSQRGAAPGEGDG
jgi:ribulose-phosphate 3-epimerase